MLYPVHVLAWILRMGVVLPLWVLGFPICLYLALTRSWSLQFSPYFGREMLLWTPRWAWLWNSFEDGVTGNIKWNVKHVDWPVWLRAFVWCAWRNPVNGLRFVYPFGIRVDPERIRARSNCPNSPQDDWTGDRVLWSYVWQGPFAGFWIRWPWRSGHAQFRIGWKLLPRDVRGVPDTDYRSRGCGFGLQLQLRG